MTSLEKLAVRRIQELADQGYMAIVQNHRDMGVFATTDSGFDKACRPLNEIQKWAAAILEQKQ